jgi:hypothetical protein
MEARRVEPGNALGCHDLNNRGHSDWVIEITVWPRQHHYRLTTGRECKNPLTPTPINLTSQEQKMCAILGLDALGFATFLRNWQPSERAAIELRDIRRSLRALGDSERRMELDREREHSYANQQRKRRMHGR